jgi:hypothetical protein
VNKTNAVSVKGLPAGINGTGCTDDVVQVWMINHGVAQNTVDDPICQMMSQDHYIRLLMGLTLVCKLVDQNANFNNTLFYDGNTFFESEAKAIIHRIVTHFQNNYWLLYQPGKSPGFVMGLTMSVAMAAGWIGAAGLLGPFGLPLIISSTMLYTSADLCQTINWGEYNKLVYRGNTAMKYAYGWAKAASFATGSNSYFDAFSASSEAILIWKSLSQYSPTSLVALPSNIRNSLINGAVGNVSQILTLAAIGDSWHQLFGRDVTEDHLMHIDSDFNYNWKLYSLLWAVLHHKTSSIPTTDIEALLDLAPCAGPSVNDLNGWCNRNRFNTKPSEELDINKGNARNGLDYMLLYNLYYIYNRATLPSYAMSWAVSSNCNVFYRTNIDIYHPNQQQSFPTSACNLGTNPWNQIATLTNPLYRAGFDIHLYSSPIGHFFHATNGSIFHAVANEASDCDGLGSFSNNVQRQGSTQPIINIKEISLNVISPFSFDVEVFPNPASSFVNVSFVNSNELPVVISIIDMQGHLKINRKVETSSFVGSVEISTKTLAPGIYFITFKTNENTCTKKLIINND